MLARSQLVALCSLIRRNVPCYSTTLELRTPRGNKGVRMSEISVTLKPSDFMLSSAFSMQQCNLTNAEARTYYYSAKVDDLLLI